MLRLVYRFSKQVDICDPQVSVPLFRFTLTGVYDSRSSRTHVDADTRTDETVYLP